MVWEASSRSTSRGPKNFTYSSQYTIVGSAPRGKNGFASSFGSFVHHLLPSGKRMTMRLLVRSRCVVSHRKFLGGWTKYCCVSPLLCLTVIVNWSLLSLSSPP